MTSLDQAVADSEAQGLQEKAKRAEAAAASLDYPTLLGDLYARYTLDAVIETASAVAKDFAARPEFYKGDQVPVGIVDLRIAYGYAALFPNRAQRQEIASPIFGLSDGYAPGTSVDKFRSLRKPLFDACITFSERTIAQSIEGLRQRVISALKLFQPHLSNFDGRSVRLGSQQVVQVSELAFEILRSQGIAQVFGVNPPPPAAWPIGSNDSNGALLIRSIGEKLQLPPEYLFNEEKFQRLRRVAEQGRLALRAILLTPPNGDLDDALVTSIYTWAISLRDYWGQ